MFPILSEQHLLSVFFLNKVSPQTGENIQKYYIIKLSYQSELIQVMVTSNIENDDISKFWDNLCDIFIKIPDIRTNGMVANYDHLENVRRTFQLHKKKVALNQTHVTYEIILNEVKIRDGEQGIKATQFLPFWAYFA